MFGLSPIYILVLGLVCVILFGNRLPSVMRSLGRSVVEFKKGVNGIEDEIDSTMKQVNEKSKDGEVNK
ncbi:MAG: twin-arginine translocase TatA/TatE family subunit [Planctomycetaceae bacterium]|jgi:sec-independent protein translocase protein TatA|nr:twin-arginine translocase TatA/TatE family subunit [Planctomycetaceae bacterium]